MRLSITRANSMYEGETNNEGYKNMVLCMFLAMNLMELY